MPRTDSGTCLHQLGKPAGTSGGSASGVPNQQGGTKYWTKCSMYPEDPKDLAPNCSLKSNDIDIMWNLESISEPKVQFISFISFYCQRKRKRIAANMKQKLLLLSKIMRFP